MEIVVGIGEYAVSNKNDIIKTYALASCVALTAYSPKRKAAGMAHIVLPTPGDMNMVTSRPCYYATTGVPLLINKLCEECGCSKNELEVSIFGGADSIRREDVFKIGARNIEAVRNALSDLNMTCRIAEVGGTDSRTIELDLGTGMIKVVRQPLVI